MESVKILGRWRSPRFKISERVAPGPNSINRSCLIICFSSGIFVVEIVFLGIWSKVVQAPTIFKFAIVFM